MMLFVGNLPAGTSDGELEELFSPYGVVTSARITTSTFSDRSRGFGVVEMLRESGELAISELNGQQIDCMVLRVNEAKGEAMKKIRHSGSITFLCLIGLQLCIGIPGDALAETAMDRVPENAAANSYGSGWRCNAGFLESDGACEAVEIPEHGYATTSSYRTGWKCSHGFEETNGSCIPVEVPANAYIDPSRGDSWKCSRGYREADNTCVAIDVPQDGHLNESIHGLGWECDRGYRAKGGACIAVTVPANAYPTYTTYGNGWECRRGYKEIDGGCDSIRVPANGYLTEPARGSGWACERGFRANGDQCEELRVPANAHLDYGGNDWDCNKPYSKRSDGCVLTKTE